MSDEMAKNKPDSSDKYLYYKIGKKDIEEFIEILNNETEVPIRQGK